MNLAGWRFLVFALIGAGAIVLLASVGTPGKREESIDRHTGERIRVVRNVADAVAEARDTGNVRGALEAVRLRLKAFPQDEVLECCRAVFEAELAEPFTAPDPAHPEAEVLKAEQERALRLREELDRRVEERLDREALLALLTDLEADSAVGKAVEEFFAPLARWRPEHPEGPWRPDEMAARALAQIEDPGQRSEAELFLEVAAAFQAQGRQRARLRWLLRGYGAHPEAPEFLEQLVATYLEHGRVREAFLVIGTALNEEPENYDLWRRRARVGGWLSLPASEIEAYETLLKKADSKEIRERLIDLYGFTGRADEAVPHALHLARDSTDPEVLERPARLALAGGNVDHAISLLEELAQSRPDDEWYWRERIVTYAWQDQRVDTVVAQLDRLRRRYPEGEYERRLEETYRRRDRPRELAALLEERLQRQPDNAELRQEFLALLAALGEETRVKQFMLGQIQEDPDPRGFFENLQTYRALELEGLEEVTRKAARSEALKAEDAPVALRSLYPMLDEAPFRDAALEVALRFPDGEMARGILLQLIDSQPDDPARAQMAERVFREHPTNAYLLKAWMERASWAGAVESEVEARELWRKANPDDGENLAALGNLYKQVGRAEEAVVLLRVVAQREGLDSDATLRLVEALFAAGHDDEAVEWLEKRANLPGATLEDRLEVAEQLFSTERFDRALRFYMAVLDEQPSHPHALLRAGQIRSWTNDARGAIPFFERRLAATDEEAADVRFYVGESHWSIREPEQGRKYHELALAELEPRTDRSLEQDIMVAKMLTRFGRTDEARPLFEKVLAAVPDDVNLVLDYADAMIAVRELEKARELVEQAKTLAPKRARTMQTDGKVLLLEHRYEDAVAVFEETIRLHGPDAGTQSELARSYELAGRWVSASEAYTRSLKLHPGNRDVSAALERLADEVANLLHASGAFRVAGEDDWIELWANGSITLKSERTRAGLALGYSRYSGIADGVNGGQTDVTADVVHAQVALFHRFRRLHSVAGGIAAYPGAPGDLPLGGWAGLRLVAAEPYRSLDVKLFAHLLWEQPAAAPGLGGRTSGVRAALQHDIGKRFWGRVELVFENLSIDPGGLGTIDDNRFRGSASLGWRILEGGQRVADPLAFTQSALPGLVGAQVQRPPKETVGPLVSAWVVYEGIRLLGDQQLAQILPVGTRFDYLTVGARGDFHLATGWGAKAEGYLGYDLYNADPIFGVEAGLTWRPSYATEFTLVGGYGTALGRADAADSFLVRLGFVYRW